MSNLFESPHDRLIRETSTLLRTPDGAHVGWHTHTSLPVVRVHCLPEVLDSFVPHWREINAAVENALTTHCGDSIKAYSGMCFRLPLEEFADISYGYDYRDLPYGYDYQNLQLGRLRLTQLFTMDLPRRIDQDKAEEVVVKIGQTLKEIPGAQDIAVECLDHGIYERHEDLYPRIIDLKRRKKPTEQLERLTLRKVMLKKKTRREHLEGRRVTNVPLDSRYFTEAEKKLMRTEKDLHFEKYAIHAGLRAPTQEEDERERKYAENRVAEKAARDAFRRFAALNI
jgi:hypothetical protein